MAAATDGTSNTLLCGEVKAWTPYSRANSASEFDANTIPDVATVENLLNSATDRKAGPALDNCTGRTEWPDGRCHHSSFTTTFAPNVKVKYGTYAGAI